MVMVCTVEDAIEVESPVVAAGGIATGDAIVASILLGARGVMIGTRFVATEESVALPVTKIKLLRAITGKATC
jgi:NAD(P)H-dependent flavin oxidoreductase YrpB (nitropropane dioxygenase family)